MKVKQPKGVVITTSEHTKAWLQECLDSLDGVQYPVVIRHNTEDDNGFELTGIAMGKDMFYDFVHLMDTTVVKDISLFEKLFAMEGHVFLTEGGYHYMGKFVSQSLPEIPVISTKEEAIKYELTWLPQPHTSLHPNLPVITEVFEKKHGRINMVLENIYLKKWKATWK